MDDQTSDPTMPGGLLYEYYKCDTVQLTKVLSELPPDTWVRTNRVGNINVYSKVDDKWLGYITLRNNDCEFTELM